MLLTENKETRTVWVLTRRETITEEIFLEGIFDSQDDAFNFATGNFEKVSWLNLSGHIYGYLEIDPSVVRETFHIEQVPTKSSLRRKIKYQ